MKATVEIENECIENVFRTVKVDIKEVSKAEGERILKEITPTLKDDEIVYQICAPCKGCELDQPFYDYMNGFRLLNDLCWKNDNPKWAYNLGTAKDSTQEMLDQDGERICKWLNLGPELLKAVENLLPVADLENVAEAYKDEIEAVESLVSELRDNT